MSSARNKKEIMYSRYVALPGDWDARDVRAQCRRDVRRQLAAAERRGTRKHVDAMHLTESNLLSAAHDMVDRGYKEDGRFSSTAPFVRILNPSLSLSAAHFGSLLGRVKSNKPTMAVLSSQKHSVNGKSFYYG
jgi:hypothetical protein